MKQPSTSRLGFSFWHFSTAPKQVKNRPLIVRLKTRYAFAPWGMNYAMLECWNLQEVSILNATLAGSQDDDLAMEMAFGICKVLATSIASLLTYDNATHSAGAVMLHHKNPMYLVKNSF